MGEKNKRNSVESCTFQLNGVQKREKRGGQSVI